MLVEIVIELEIKKSKGVLLIILTLLILAIYPGWLNRKKS